nr:hypothetical protein [Streptomyces katrae]
MLEIVTLQEVLAELAAARADEMDADTVNREPSITRKAIGWWQRQGWIEGDPTIGIERRPAPPGRTKALAENQIAALWRLDVTLREKTQWKMLYESAARADEVLCLNVSSGVLRVRGGWVLHERRGRLLRPRGPGSPGRNLRTASSGPEYADTWSSTPSCCGRRVRRRHRCPAPRATRSTASHVLRQSPFARTSLSTFTLL